jgi:hypothetical protein
VELLVVENPGGAQQELPDELMRLRGEVCRHLELFVPDAIAQCPDGDPLLRIQILAIDVVEQFVELRRMAGIESHRQKGYKKSQQE